MPLYAVPDDLLTVDLADALPGAQGQARCAARVEGRRVVPVLVARGHRSAARRRSPARCSLYVDDPVEAFFLQIQGSGRVGLADGSVMRVGYADQNGHPYRSIGRVLIERGELTLGQRVDAGRSASGAGAIPTSCPALLDENPSYVFFREVPPPAPGTLDAQIDGPFGSLGVPLLARARDRRRPALDPARHAGVPRDDVPAVRRPLSG